MTMKLEILFVITLITATTGVRLFQFSLWSNFHPWINCVTKLTVYTHRSIRRSQLISAC